MARKILLADDSVTAQNMGRKILADAGYEVITVNNGSAALKKIAESRPDVIVLDVYMPGYSGLEVCQRLKEAQETSRIPILLTVGKLEPFKPEEAKRARAEAFIVKPFEASELLAALTKLEDKIVPRSEPSKPGRFARANAAIDEGRYDKTVAIEEDSGWKNRIAFPSKKKKAAADDNGEDPAIYNAVNKDLRTTVEHKPEAVAHQASVEEGKVDLGALVPEGLPKDVTPEEIAALAAAALQVKGKLADAKWDESTPEQPAAAPVEAKPAAGDTGEIKVSETPATISADAAAEEKHVKETVSPAAEPAVEVPAPPAVAFAEQNSGQDRDHKIEAQAEKPAEVPQEVAQEVASHVAAGADATVEASTAPAPAAEVASSSHSDVIGSSASRVEEPVVMTAAAAAGMSAAPSRWSAVAIALDAGESSISLDEEMQKAHAAFAAAEAAQAVTAAPVTAPAEIPPVAVEAAPIPAEHLSPVEAVTPELLGSVSIPVPEAEKTPAAEASIAETVAPVVKAFETVAPRDFAPEPIYSSAIAEHAPAETAPVPAIPEPEAQSSVEETPQEIAADQSAAKTETEEPARDAAPSSTLQEPSVVLESEALSAKAEEPAQPVAEAAAQSEKEPEAHEEESEVKAASPIAPEAPAAAAEANGRGEAPAKESEIVDTTAAAWASWRRIRESGDSRGKSLESSNSSKSDEEPSHETAAMAAAAGAERTPEDAAKPGEPDEIANIVDGVLADLRPKIVAEISKKLGKKKK